MPTLQEILDIQKNARANATDSEFIGGMNKLISVLSNVDTALSSLKNSVDEQIVLNKASREAGQASDLNQTIRRMLEAKIESDSLDKARYSRYMDMVDSVLPPVTDEQIKAALEQQRASREQLKAIRNATTLETKNYDIQTKTAKDVASYQIATAQRQLDLENERIASVKASEEFAARDKFGTISNTIEGLVSKSQDAFSKFMVQGLGRLVHEKGEEPSKKRIEKKYSDMSSDVQADYDVVKKLIDTRESRVVDLVKQAVEREVSILKQSSKPPKHPKKSDISEDTSAPVVKVIASSTQSKISDDLESSVPQAIIKEYVPINKGISTTETARDVAAPRKELDHIVETKESNKAPKAIIKNGKVNTRTTTQGNTSSNVIQFNPNSTTTPPKPVSASNGMFGSKAGFISTGALGKGLGTLGQGIGSIVTTLGSLSGNFVKFLGPWGLVASSLMSFDRIVPIISEGAGALMDLTKLAIPFLTASIIEGFNTLLGFGNSLLAAFDASPFGSKLVKQKGYEQVRVQEELNYVKELRSLSNSLPEPGKAAGGKDVTYAPVEEFEKPKNLAEFKKLTPNVTSIASPEERSIQLSRNEPTPENQAVIELASTLSSQIPVMMEGVKDAILAASNSVGAIPIPGGLYNTPNHLFIV